MFIAYSIFYMLVAFGVALALLQNEIPEGLDKEQRMAVMKDMSWGRVLALTGTAIVWPAFLAYLGTVYMMGNTEPRKSGSGFGSGEL